MHDSALIEKLIGFAKDLLPVAIAFVVGMLVVKTILRLIDRSLEKTHMERAAISLIKSLFRVVLYVLLGMVLLEQAGIKLTGVVALASVASLAISLSFQNALTNVIGGFTLLSTRPFKSGDYVEIAGQGGTVQSIDVTYTRLTTADNKTISIPNSAVVASQITNYSSSGTRRIDITVGASYDAPLEVVKAALLRAANIPQTLFTPAPFAGVKNYGDHAIEYVLQVWTGSEDYWPAFYTINENIHREFMTDHIEFTYPHLNVHMDK